MIQSYDCDAASYLSFFGYLYPRFDSVFARDPRRLICRRRVVVTTYPILPAPIVDLNYDSYFHEAKGLYHGTEAVKCRDHGACDLGNDQHLGRIHVDGPLRHSDSGGPDRNHGAYFHLCSLYVDNHRHDGNR